MREAPYTDLWILIATRNGKEVDRAYALAHCHLPFCRFSCADWTDSTTEESICATFDTNGPEHLTAIETSTLWMEKQIERYGHLVGIETEEESIEEEQQVSDVLIYPESLPEDLPSGLEYWTASEVAECLTTGSDLYVKLYEFQNEATKQTPLWSSVPDDLLDLNCDDKAYHWWTKLTEAEQVTIATAYQNQ